MADSYFLYRDPPTHDFDLRLSMHGQPTIENLDRVFVQSLASMGRSIIPDFLSYHLNNSPASKNEFLDHIEAIVQLSPYSGWLGIYAGTPILDWVSKQRESVAKKSTVRKKRPSFQDLFKDPSIISELNEELIIAGYLSNDMRWKGKAVHLSSLIIALDENGFFKRPFKDDKTMYAEVFVEYYGENMKANTVRRPPSHNYFVEVFSNDILSKLK